VSAFQPSNIAKKKELSTEKKKLPNDIQENINLKILHYIVAEARPLITRVFLKISQRFFCHTLTDQFKQLF
jgi:hypothetical protein